jgi:hypothetical protein
MHTRAEHPELDGRLARTLVIENAELVLGRFTHADGHVHVEHAILAGTTMAAVEVQASVWTVAWAADAFVNVIVRDGVVDLWGSYMAARQDEAVIVAAENVPGVRLVRNHMTWVDPVSGLVVYNPDAERSRATEPAATQT